MHSSSTSSCRAVGLVLAALSVLAQGLKLELASVLFRHGDRSPTHVYPNDPYQADFWPQGLGQLSTEGMRQEYFLGELLRKRYVETTDLIHPNYTRVQVYMRSTDYDRTLMSAECQLAALFPPEGDQLFNASLPWQPIPVHTVPKEEDNLLLAFENCPAYNKLREADTKTQAYINLEKENKDFFTSLEKDTGYEAVNLTNIYTIHGTLFVEKTDNLTLPSWVTDELMWRLLNLTQYTSGLLFDSVEKRKMTAGNWLGKVLLDMQNKTKYLEEEDIKLYLYSAHDTTVECMLTALGVFNGLLPPYVAAVFIELYSSENSKDYHLSLFYRNETDSDHLMPLHVDSCVNQTLCTLQEFTELVSPVLLDDWEKECGLSSHTSSKSGDDHVVLVLAVLLGVCVLLVLVMLSVCVAMQWYTKRHLTRRSYQRLPVNET